MKDNRKFIEECGRIACELLTTEEGWIVQRVEERDTLTITTFCDGVAQEQLTFYAQDGTCIMAGRVETKKGGVSKWGEVSRWNNSILAKCDYTGGYTQFVLRDNIFVLVEDTRHNVRDTAGRFTRA